MQIGVRTHAQREQRHLAEEGILVVTLQTSLEQGGSEIFSLTVLSRFAATAALNALVIKRCSTNGSTPAARKRRLDESRG